MTYEDIKKANSEMEMLDLKGKEYAMVPQRVTAFRKLYPDGFITTEIIANDGTTVLMQAKAGYFREDHSMCILGTGFAQEVKGKGLVNGTSHIENCETSAVGRALGFLGLGIDGGGICSAEELANAVTAQKQMQNEKTAQKPAQKEEPPKAPAKQAVKPNPVGDYISNEIKFLQEQTETASYSDMRAIFNSWVRKLTETGKLAPVDWKTASLEQAKAVVEAVKASLFAE